MKKCIIYDCDGVIVDSEIIAARIDVKFFSSIGLHLTEEECIKLFIGKSTSCIRKIVFEQFELELSDEFFARIHKAIFEAFRNELKPLMENTLFIHKQGKIKQCIASNSKEDWVLHALNVTNQFKFFEPSRIFTAQQVEKGKPAPDLFLFAAKKMGYEPKDCVVVEDSPAGIEAALAAKMEVIGFIGANHAQYPWYRERIASYKIPIVHNDIALSQLLQSIILHHSVQC